MSDEIENEVSKRFCPCCNLEITPADIHAPWCLACDICEERFKKHDVAVYETDRKFLACERCALVEQVSYYRLKLEQSKESIDRMKSELNLFRSMLLRPETMAAIADDPASAQPSVFNIRQRLTGIETLSLDQLIFWMETYELFAREISTIAGKKSTEKELKEHLQEKTKKAILETNKAQEKAKKAANDGLLGTYTELEKKAIKTMMKSLRCDEATAANYLKNMNAGGQTK